MRSFQRIVLIVMDSVGLGAMPDAADFGDEGSDTLGNIAASRPLTIPNLIHLGISNARPLKHLPAVTSPAGCFGKAALASRGKDTTSGHWEMMGVVLQQPFPTYPDGFPQTLLNRISETVGRRFLGNVAASGTEIIESLGPQHMETGQPILYTSADSVFQVAAHEDVIPISEQYQICKTARELLTGDHEVGRVIARPFIGAPGNFRRTRRRKDFAIPPPCSTVLDNLLEAGHPVTAVGKIASIYCYRGITTELETSGNDETADRTLQAMRQVRSGLIFSNFVDFDMLYGHRNDVEGYASALEAFDLRLGDILQNLEKDDLLILTSDHGCDPTTASTDHSREYALLLTYSASGDGGAQLGTRRSLADIGATVAENFGVDTPEGESFLGEVLKA